MLTWHLAVMGHVTCSLGGQSPNRRGGGGWSEDFCSVGLSESMRACFWGFGQIYIYMWTQK